MTKESQQLLLYRTVLVPRHKYLANLRYGKCRPRHRQIEIVIDIRPAHSTLRNLDDISGINGSSRHHRPYELKFLNATLLPTRDIEWRPRGFIASRAIAAVDFLPPQKETGMDELDDIKAFLPRLVLASLM